MMEPNMSETVITTSEAIAAAAAAAALNDVTSKESNLIETTAAAVGVAPVAVAMTTIDTTNPVIVGVAFAPMVNNPSNKIIPAVPLPVPKRNPSIPSERDVIVGSNLHKGTILLHDLVQLHYFLSQKQRHQITEEERKPAASIGVVDGDVTKLNTEGNDDNSAAGTVTTTTEKEEKEKKPEQEPTTTKVEPPADRMDIVELAELPADLNDIEELAAHLIQLFAKGRPYEMSGLKDVPTPFFKGEGCFFEQTSSSSEDMKWKRLDDDEAKAYVSQLIISSFRELCDDRENNDDVVGIIQSANIYFVNSKEKNTVEGETKSAPRPCDVLFLPVESTSEDNFTYEPHQSGNKHLLFMASQYVSVKTKDSASRIKAAFALITSKVQVNSGSEMELVDTDPRYIIQHTLDGQTSWSEMDRRDLAEFAAIFVFEVYLEKRIYEETVISPNNIEAAANVTPSSLQPTMNDLLAPSTANKPSDEPIPAPTTHDVLFGRGGMTNGHPGNRRFRDIIALHRPDYIQATKMDKPNVARKIVRAIRSGNPSGRFLRKGTHNMWVDVGDKVAAEKTSQGLRERSNAEKRQRSAMRESLRIDNDGGGGAVIEPDAKKIKLDVAAISMSVDSVIPLNLNAKRITNIATKRSKKGTDEESTTESLPANAVDKDGNMLVTDHDILCGRGGLTNHHKGNKRFRDIVALHRPDYVRAPKIQKPSVARVIVRAIRNGDPPGRFLRKDATTGRWYDIGDKKAAEKTSQALREKSDEEKEVTKIPAGFTSPTMIVPTAATTAAAAATNVDAALGVAALNDTVAADISALNDTVTVAAAATRAFVINKTEEIMTEADVNEIRSKGEPSSAEDVAVNNEVVKEVDEPTHIAV